ncbi:NYN domain-containing protein [Leptolyngbya iicbica]|uniref:NYN domain-containing protein n=1 Tax=Leptolyngbya iicbica LK TaxID=2294035 RepID=A0A4Q7E4W0_9CYAN|nr:NYN domain-containing protein [Leptolyngbya sp. LK]RZM77258.1 hypothetical protein DYY88_16565 [Leptolyngbya sp. LK]
MNDPAANHDRYEAIAAKLSDALIQIQAAHPDWVQARYRLRSLAANRAKLVQKFVELLQGAANANVASDQVLELLAKLLEPVVNETQFYQQVRHLVATELSSSIVPLREQSLIWQPELELATQSAAKNENAIAILLLDAENIDLNQEAEAWLETHCNYPMTLKFAFGNWKTLGDRDAQLHRRGYQLLHVPKGKNHADDKMTIIGSSILVHFPNIKAAIVGSNDNDLENLRHTLRFQGLDVSLLQRHQQTLKLINCKTKESTTLTLLAATPMPSVEQGIQYCQTYLANAEAPKILISQLSSDFSRDLGFPISTFVKHHQLGKTPKAFFQKSTRFKVTAGHNASQWYVSNCAQFSSENTDTDNSQSQKFTISTLRRVCVGIAKALIQKQSGSAVSIGLLAITFRQQHGQPIKTVLKQLKLGQSLPEFLQTCNGLELRQEKLEWMITLL